MQSSKFLRAPPLALGFLATLTPSEFEVRIIDNDFETIPYEEEWDLVGITATTPVAKRAYAIAERFRVLNIPTVLGGFHPSFLPEESAQFADSVVIGEAGNVWHRVLNDCKENKLKKIYRDENNSQASPLVLRKGLFNPKFYYPAIQLTKGCTFKCSFCSIRKMYKKYQVMPIKLALQNLYNLRGKHVYFVDDNLFCNGSYCKKLFKSMIEARLNKKWWVQAPVTLTDNDEMLKLAVESGLISCQLGLESISQEALLNSRKYQNKVSNFRRVIKTLHDHGITVVPFFLFGFDTDKKDVFARTVDFASDIECDAVAFWLLTPFPGTELFDDFQRQDRLLTKDWDFYDGYHCVFKPRNMTPEELENGLYHSFEDFYGRSFKFQTILNRFKGKQMRRMVLEAPALFYQVGNLIKNITPSINRLKRSLLRDRAVFHQKLAPK
ncbi:MAG: B12-binding domain-containing radical SAM protein [Candidatus Helarchaeota archaeon]